MATTETKEGITYEKEMIFHRLVDLYFSMVDIDPGFGLDDDEGLILGESDGIELAESKMGEADSSQLLPPILAFDDAYEAFRKSLFNQFSWVFAGLAIPSHENADLRKEFEAFTMKEYGILIALSPPKKDLKPPKTKPQLTVVPTDPPKK